MKLFEGNDTTLAKHRELGSSKLSSQWLDGKMLDVMLRRLASRGHHEKVTMLDSWRPGHSLTSILRSAQEELLKSGCVVKVIARPETSIRIDEMCLNAIYAAGAQIRVSNSDLPEAIILDGHLALLRVGVDWRRTNSFIVIQEAPITAALQSSFATTWNNSISYDQFHHSRIYPDDETVSSILDLLSKGRTDASAARFLGVSLRTYRRRVSDIMEYLGADSRFQAGVLASRLGLVRNLEIDLLIRTRVGGRAFGPYLC
jgi:DNA-binding CsgD family transcriptional regulator